MSPNVLSVSAKLRMEQQIKEKHKKASSTSAAPLLDGHSPKNTMATNKERVSRELSLRKEGRAMEEGCSSPKIVKKKRKLGDLSRVAESAVTDDAPPVASPLKKNKESGEQRRRQSPVRQQEWAATDASQASATKKKKKKRRRLVPYSAKNTERSPSPSRKEKKNAARDKVALEDTTKQPAIHNDESFTAEEETLSNKKSKEKKEERQSLDFSSGPFDNAHSDSAANPTSTSLQTNDPAPDDSDPSKNSAVPSIETLPNKMLKKKKKKKHQASDFSLDPDARLDSTASPISTSKQSNEPARDDSDPSKNNAVPSIQNDPAPEAVEPFPNRKLKKKKKKEERLSSEFSSDALDDVSRDSLANPSLTRKQRNDPAPDDNAVPCNQNDPAPEAAEPFQNKKLKKKKKKKERPSSKFSLDPLDDAGRDSAANPSSTSKQRKDQAPDDSDPSNGNAVPSVQEDSYLDQASQSMTLESSLEAVSPKIKLKKKKSKPHSSYSTTGTASLAAAAGHSQEVARASAPPSKKKENKVEAASELASWHIGLEESSADEEGPVVLKRLKKKKKKKQLASGFSRTICGGTGSVTKSAPAVASSLGGEPSVAGTDSGPTVQISLSMSQTSFIEEAPVVPKKKTKTSAVASHCSLEVPAAPTADNEPAITALADDFARSRTHELSVAAEDGKVVPTVSTKKKKPKLLTADPAAVTLGCAPTIESASAPEPSQKEAEEPASEVGGASESTVHKMHEQEEGSVPLKKLKKKKKKKTKLETLESASAVSGDGASVQNGSHRPTIETASDPRCSSEVTKEPASEVRPVSESWHESVVEESPVVGLTKLKKKKKRKLSSLESVSEASGAGDARAFLFEEGNRAGASAVSGESANQSWLAHDAPAEEQNLLSADPAVAAVSVTNSGPVIDSTPLIELSRKQEEEQESKVAGDSAVSVSHESVPEEAPVNHTHKLKKRKLNSCSTVLADTDASLDEAPICAFSDEKSASEVQGSCRSMSPSSSRVIVPGEEKEQNSKASASSAEAVVAVASSSVETGTAFGPSELDKEETDIRGRQVSPPREREESFSEGAPVPPNTENQLAATPLEECVPLSPSSKGEGEKRKTNEAVCEPAKPAMQQSFSEEAPLETNTMDAPTLETNTMDTPVSVAVVAAPGAPRLKKQKRFSPYRVKVGCVVALRFQPDGNDVTFSRRRRRPREHQGAPDSAGGVDGTSIAEDSNSRAYCNAKDGSLSFTTTWANPVPGRDDGLCLIGKRIRCFFPREVLKLVREEHGGDTKKQRRVLEGEVIRLLDYGQPSKTKRQPKPKAADGNNNNIREEECHFFKVELLVDKTVYLEHFPFLPRTDEDVDPSKLSSGTAKRNHRLEEAIRGKNRATVKLKLTKADYMHITDKPAATTGIRWAVQKRVPTKLFHTKSRQSTSKDQQGGTLPANRGKTQGNTADGPKKRRRTKATTGTETQYVGDGTDSREQQTANWRWAVSRYNDNMFLFSPPLRQLPSNQQRDGGDDNFTDMLSILLSGGMVGEVVKVDSSSSSTTCANTPTLATVTLRRLILPEHTASGRVAHHHGPFDVFYDYDCTSFGNVDGSRIGTHEEAARTVNYNAGEPRDVLFQVPVEQLVIIGRQLSARNPIYIEGAPSLELLTVSQSYSLRRDAYIELPETMAEENVSRERHEEKNGCHQTNGSNGHVAAHHDGQLSKNCTRSYICHRCRRECSADCFLCREQDCSVRWRKSMERTMTSWCRHCLTVLGHGPVEEKKLVNGVGENLVNGGHYLSRNVGDDTGGGQATSPPKLLHPCCMGSCDCRECLLHAGTELQDELLATMMEANIQQRIEGNISDAESDVEAPTDSSPFAITSLAVQSSCMGSSPIDFSLSYDFVADVCTLPMPSERLKFTRAGRTPKKGKRAPTTPPTSPRPSRARPNSPKRGVEKRNGRSDLAVGDTEPSVPVEDYRVFKPTCARSLQYDPARKKTSLGSNSLEGIACKDKPRNLRQQRALLDISASVTPKKEEKGVSKTSSRAARANQRRFMKDVAAIEGAGTVKNSLLGVDTLASREPQLRFGRSGIHAWGVFADEDIAAGEMIIEYRGELIGNAMAEKREEEYEAAKIGSDYMFRIDSLQVCDATHQGNLARFINASCDPNCHTKIITCDGVKRIVIYAKRFIRASEELSYDYKFPVEYDESKRIPCHCGAKECRGFMNWDKRYVALPDVDGHCAEGKTSLKRAAEE